MRNFKTTRYTTAYELRILVQECWFGEICERTVAYVVLQSLTHRTNFVLSLLKFKTTFANQSRNAAWFGEIHEDYLLNPTLL